MIIDFHTHMFPDKIAARTIDFLSKTGGDMNPFTDGTWKGLKESTKQAGIDHSIVLPIATRPGQFHTINEFATHFQEGTLISFGSLHPESENYKEELRQIQDMGMKGIKLHPDYQDTYFNDIRYKRIISYATELGLIISVHAGQDPKCPDNIHCTPAMAEEVLNEVEPEKLVLAHMGGNGNSSSFQRLQCLRKPIPVIFKFRCIGDSKADSKSAGCKGFLQCIPNLVHFLIRQLSGGIALYSGTNGSVSGKHSSVDAALFFSKS